MRKTLELVGLTALGVLCWLTCGAFYGPSRLPDRVPTHFDAAGNPNAWGSPAGMLTLPIVAGVLYLAMSRLAEMCIRVEMKGEDLRQTTERAKFG